MFVAFTVPEFTVAMLPVEAVNELNTAVTAFNTFAARFPVTVRLLAVVEANVDDPETVKLVKNPVAKAAMLPRILVTVVDARVEEPLAFKLVVLRTVEVEFVIVPLVELTPERIIFPADRLVIVAFVRVPFVPIRLVVFVVDALVVDAFRIAALTDEVAYRVVKFPVCELVTFELLVVELIVVKFPVTAVNAFANIEVNAAIFPVILVTVVDPNVELPIVKIFAAANIPLTVVEETFNADKFPV